MELVAMIKCEFIVYLSFKIILKNTATVIRKPISDLDRF